MSVEFGTKGRGVRCPGCISLWTVEAARAGLGVDRAKDPLRPGLAHPDCLESHVFTSFDFGHSLEWVAPPYGPVLRCSTQFQQASGLWLSDVALTLPAGSRNVAIVAGGAGPTRMEAVCKGWFEGLERRSAHTRPRGQVRLSVPNTNEWALHGASYVSDGQTGTVPVPSCQLPNDSIGFALFDTYEEAAARALLEVLERSMLDDWWAATDSVRCSEHSHAATQRLGALDVDGSGADVWHYQWEGITVTGCLWWWSDDESTISCSFGSAASPDAAIATKAAVDESSHLRHGSDLYVVDGRPVFGPSYPPASLPPQYIDELHEHYPLGECHLKEIRPSKPLAQLGDEVRAVVLDYGNSLTDSLGLHVLRTWVPDMRKFSLESTNTAGFRATFAPGHAG